MTRAHLTTRIITSATAPAVRRAGPAVADAVKHFLQFFGFLLLGCVVILTGAIFHANQIPWHVIKSAALILGLTPLAFAFLVVLEQIRLTYHKQDPSVYDAVEPFEQRRPPTNG